VRRLCIPVSRPRATNVIPFSSSITRRISMTPPCLDLFHSVPASSRSRFLCLVHPGPSAFAERGTGYSAESLTIAGSVEAVCLLSRAFRGSRTGRVCWG
jgi:hypothetical protein